MWRGGCTSPHVKIRGIDGEEEGCRLPPGLVLVNVSGPFQLRIKATGSHAQVGLLERKKLWKFPREFFPLRVLYRRF